MKQGSLRNRECPKHLHFDSTGKFQIPRNGSEKILLSWESEGLRIRGWAVSGDIVPQKRTGYVSRAKCQIRPGNLCAKIDGYRGISRSRRIAKMPHLLYADFKVGERNFAKDFARIHFAKGCKENKNCKALHIKDLNHLESKHSVKGCGMWPES